MSDHFAKLLLCTGLTNLKTFEMKAENRHYDKVHKKKAHPAAKCGNAKCLICHSDKVFKMPNRQLLRENSKQQLK